MKNVQSEVILMLTEKLSILFGPKATSQIVSNLKHDDTIVTEIDLFVSTLIKAKLRAHPDFNNYNFFSEEDFDRLIFPSAILDPIDGTRELVKGRAECAVSLALMKSPDLSDPSNYGWIYNPFSGFSIDSAMPFVPTIDKSKHKILGMVSRLEFEKGYFSNFINIDQKIVITPRGSIAFKLGLLASGGCDFVLSLSPKHIWDIAAGTVLCAQRGFKFYQNGIEITKLDEVLINGVLMWAPEHMATELWAKFKSEKKS
jgi:myo-inositol-1(or 4)-monophosphatase